MELERHATTQSRSARLSVVSATSGEIEREVLAQNDGDWVTSVVWHPSFDKRRFGIFRLDIFDLRIGNGEIWFGFVV